MIDERAPVGRAWRSLRRSNEGHRKTSQVSSAYPRSDLNLVHLSLPPPIFGYLLFPHPRDHESKSHVAYCIVLRPRVLNCSCSPRSQTAEHSLQHIPHILSPFPGICCPVFFKVPGMIRLGNLWSVHAEKCARLSGDLHQALQGNEATSCRVRYEGCCSEPFEGSSSRISIEELLLSRISKSEPSDTAGLAFGCTVPACTGWNPSVPHGSVG